MRYCPDCGDPHECAAAAEREDAKTRVQLATIEANRDIRIAELAATSTATEAAAAVDIASADAELAAADAEGRAAGMERVIDDLSGAGAVDAQAPAEVPAEEFPVAEAEPEPAGAAAPPVAEPPAAEKKRGGYWDNYA